MIFFSKMIFLLSLAEVLPTILICTFLACIVVLIIAYLIRCKKSGKSSCGCNCSGCAMKESCHKK